MRIKIVIAAVFFSASLGAQDLDLPDLSNYQHNWMIYNPAFTGSQKVSSISLFYRQIDFEIPAPVYSQLSWHSPTRNEKVAIGVSYFNESFPGHIFNGSGTSSRQSKDNLYFNYAYRIETDESWLAFGISGGFTAYSIDFQPNLLHPGDSYLEREGFEIIPNVGAGVLYHTEDFFIGVSVPKFLSRGKNLQDIRHDFKAYTGILTGGYKFRVSDNFIINPSAMLLYKLHQPLNIQGGLNFGLMDEKLWFGAVYKRPDFLSAIFNIKLSPKVLLGYAYSFSMDETDNYYDKTHELVLRYEFIKTIPSNTPFYY